MAQVKKAFEGVVSFLEQHTDSQVSEILDEVISMCAPKARVGGGGSARNHIADVNGNPVAILDYFFKRWMPLVGNDAVEFGKKAGSPTGLNNLCKQASSEWSKRQRDAKQANESLLQRVIDGELSPEDIPSAQADIEAARTEVPDTDLGFATEEEVRSYLTDNGVQLA